MRERYPLALHGVSLSIGSTDPLNPNYLKSLKKLVKHIDPQIVSDHLCWSGVNGYHLHDLLPLPHTEESIKHVVRRIQKVQEYLNRKILLENVSTYITYQHDEMKEWEFLVEVAGRSGCGILLDINNIYVNSVNHQFDPYCYIDAVPGQWVGQFHMAGHTNMGKFLFDTHGGNIIDAVWDLYRYALKKWGAISTLIEWDDQIRDFSELSDLARQARSMSSELTGGKKKDFDDKCVPEGVAVAHQSSKGPSLIELQNWMKSQIQPGIESSEGDSPLNEQSGEPGIERMEVYASGYLARMEEALIESYEAVRQVVGENNFSVLSHDYAKNYPSRSYNLSRAVLLFPQFLEQTEIVSSLPFLGDLSRLEMLMMRAFHAFEKEPFNLQSLEQICPVDWGNLKLNFQPSVSIIRSEWPILDIWKARKTPRNEINIELQDGIQRLLIYRSALKVKYELIDESQYLILCDLKRGNTLGQIFERYDDALDDHVRQIQQWFQNWIQVGLFTGFEIIS